MDTITEEPSGGEDTVSNEDTEHNPAENALSANITLQVRYTLEYRCMCNLSLF